MYYGATFTELGKERVGKMEQMVKDFLTQKTPVEIYHTNENGSWVWAIKGVGTNLWLDAYLSEEKAIKFCVKHQLPYTVTSKA